MMTETVHEPGHNDAPGESPAGRERPWPAEFAFALGAAALYASLMRHSRSPDSGLGGRLLYAGELDEDGRALMAAGNIAGAASLAAVQDSAAQRLAIRDGIADFLVNTLDEALRILKNEVRKQQAVAVCVAASPAAIEHQMLERGVLPDLVRSGSRGGTSHDPGPGPPHFAPNAGACPTRIAPLAPESGESTLFWSVDEAPALWLPRLDAIAMERFASERDSASGIALRWLRLAPRYLGRARGRVLRCSTVVAHNVARGLRAWAETAETPIAIRVHID